MTDLLRGLPNKIAPLVAGAALLVAAWLYVRFGSLNLARLASADMRVHVDFDSFWSSAVALRQHTDLYRTDALLPNLDPPVLAVLLSPLTELDVLPAYRLFALLTALMVVGASIAVAEWTGLSARWAAVAVAALLLSAPLQSTVALGQVYGLLTVALTAAWVAERRGRLGWSGVALGLAIALKPSLLPLLFWPVLRRRWRSLLAALAAGAVATAVGIVAAGWSAIGQWLRLLGTVQVTGFLDNDSLAALAVRWHCRRGSATWSPPRCWSSPSGGPAGARGMPSGQSPPRRCCSPRSPGTATWCCLPRRCPCCWPGGAPGPRCRCWRCR